MPETVSYEEYIDRLVAAKKYMAAATQLEEICRQQPRNVRLRQQLADILNLAGDNRKALQVLEELVNDFARAGHFARAIAALKRMQRIDPTHRDLDAKLAVLVKNQQRLAGGSGAGSAQTPTRAGAGTAPSAAQRAAQGLPKRRPVAAPTSPSPQAPQPPAPGAVAKAEHEAQILRNTIRESEVLLPAEGAQGMVRLQDSVLFRDLEVDELQALIGGLRLTSMRPGEIIVAEGEPGASLFLIASGSVRVYVRNTVGSQNHVRVMSQGDFFGEISLLKGSRRTATITAATRCEMLELDRAAVDGIARRYPKIWTIVEEFCARRAGSAEEIDARKS